MSTKSNDQKDGKSSSERGSSSITIKIGSFLGAILTCVTIVSGVIKILEWFNNKEDKLSKQKVEVEVTLRGEETPRIDETKLSPDTSKPSDSADRSVTGEGPQGNTPKNEDAVIPKEENPKPDIVEQQPKPKNPAQREKPVKKSESEKKTAIEPAKPAESAVKPMTEEERKKIVEEEKKKMDEAKKELDEKRKAEDPTGSSSKVKDDEKVENYVKEHPYNN